MKYIILLVLFVSCESDYAQRIFVDSTLTSATLTSGTTISGTIAIIGHTPVIVSDTTKVIYICADTTSFDGTSVFMIKDSIIYEAQAYDNHCFWMRGYVVHTYDRNTFDFGSYKYFTDRWKKLSPNIIIIQTIPTTTK